MAVGELEVIFGEGDEGIGDRIIGFELDECIRNVLAVSADVLDGGGASETGDLAHGFDAGEASFHGVFDDVVPVFATHDFELGLTIVSR